MNLQWPSKLYCPLGSVTDKLASQSQRCCHGYEFAIENCSQNVLQLRMFPSNVGTSILGSLTPLLVLVSVLIMLLLSLSWLGCNSLRSSREQSNNAFSTFIILTFSLSSSSRSNLVNSLQISDSSILWPLISSSFSCRRQISSDAVASEPVMVDTPVWTQVSQ